MTVSTIYRNLQRLDELKTPTARRLFLESNPVYLEQALSSLRSGDLKCINAIHKKVEAIFDPARREDRRILRMMRQIPDALSVDPLLTPYNLKLLQGYINKKSGRLISEDDNRLQILFQQWSCRLEANGLLTIPSVNKRSPINRIIEQLFIKAFEGAYRLDGEAAAGNYRAELNILRDFKTNDYPVKNGLEMHHDYNYDEEGVPDEISSYILLGMLSDKDGTLGWEGGDLLIQNDSTPTVGNIPFQMDRPYLTYEYPLNGAICLRNQNVVHQCTGIIAKQPSDQLARDLVIVNLYREKVVDPERKTRAQKERPAKQPTQKGTGPS